MIPHPIALIILDGWGQRAAEPTNAITSAHTPTWDALLASCPHTTLSASGLDVGLPAGQMGNSEVGHLTLGAGRAVLQDLTRINNAIETGAFDQNPVLLSTLDKVSGTKQALHVIGLLSPGGVHSHEEHLYALLRLAAKKNVSRIFIHAFLDGRDTAPQSAKASLTALQKCCRDLKGTKATIASISGRYYAMDRDQRYDRTKKVYELLTEEKAPYFFTSATEALMAAYSRLETDEFVQPTLITPTAAIQDNDVIVMINFRSDRARQLSHSLRSPNFSGFTRSVFPTLADFVTLTNYDTTLDASIAFPSESLENILGEYLQKKGLKQLRIAETEKYAHVTFFLNGGRETPFLEEDRILIPSPKTATYDLAPEMSAVELTEQFVAAIHQQKHDVIICNYANADMVGHTGNLKATIKAIECLDACLAKVVAALKAVGGEALITADHGNAENMLNEATATPHTAHTLERVPFIYMGRSAEIINSAGTLKDVAPTLLTLLKLAQPTEMTGRSLLALK
jgi:2,3-bisphosphoglycerate-independent phosphoglycerate mutase